MSSLAYSAELHPEPRLRCLVLASGILLFGIGLVLTLQLPVAAGYKSVMEPERLDRWPVVVGFVLDPDGYLIEIIQHDGPRPGE